jgi:hypothetical protein
MGYPWLGQNTSSNCFSAWTGGKGPPVSIMGGRDQGIKW